MPCAETRLYPCDRALGPLSQTPARVCFFAVQSPAGITCEPSPAEQAERVAPSSQTRATAQPRSTTCLTVPYRACCLSLLCRRVAPHQPRHERPRSKTKRCLFGCLADERPHCNRKQTLLTLPACCFCLCALRSRSAFQRAPNCAAQRRVRTINKKRFRMYGLWRKRSTHLDPTESLFFGCRAVV